MSNSYNKVLSEALLRQAAIDDHMNELDAIPPAEELRRMYAFSMRHEARMRALFRKEKYRARGAAIIKGARHVAVFIVVTGALLFGALLTNSEVRATVRDTIVEWFEQFTRYSFDDDTPTQEDVSWAFGYLPVGYIEEETYPFAERVSIDYVNADGDIIEFQYALASVISFAIDNEHSIFETKSYNGQVYDIYATISSEYPSYVIWKRDGYAFYLDGYVPCEELLQMAYSLIQK